MIDNAKLEATREAASAKVAELEQRFSCKVHPLVFGVPETGEILVGYFKEPPRTVKMRVMDKGLTQPITAASEIVDAYLIKEESDSRIYDEKSDNDKYYIGATYAAYALVTMSVNQFKKKSN